LKDGRKLGLEPALRQARRVRPTAALLPFSLMVMAIMTVPTLVLDDQGLPRYRHLRAEVGELRESNEELVREIAELKSEIEALRADTSYIERIARD
jgi:cell division protein FtsB